MSPTKKLISSPSGVLRRLPSFSDVKEGFGVFLSWTVLTALHLE